MLARVADLPAKILIKANNNRYTLWNTTKINNLYKFSLLVIQDTKIYTETATSTGTAAATAAATATAAVADPFPIDVLRESSRHEASIYRTTVCQTSQYILIDTQKVYEYTMEQKHRVLPSVFYRVSNGEDIEKRHHFLVTTHSAHTIPVHVLNVYIDVALQRGDECPITMDLLTRENVICTPCGHLFTREGIHNLTVCPTCRMRI